MEKESQPHQPETWLIIVCVLALAMVYVFQRLDYLGVGLSLTGAGPASPNVTFIVNRSLRLILNDMICLALIWVLFRERKYLRVAFVVFCFEFFIILPVYFLMKLSIEGTSEISSPLLSQIHRLIVNPMLMLLLIVAFYYQRYTSKS